MLGSWRVLILVNVALLLNWFLKIAICYDITNLGAIATHSLIYLQRINQPALQWQFICQQNTKKRLQEETAINNGTTRMADDDAAHKGLQLDSIWKYGENAGSDG